MKREFIEKAGGLGFKRVAFVNAEAFEGAIERARGLTSPPRITEAPREILAGAKSVAVMLYPYAVVEGAEGLPPLSSYNIASHASHVAMKALLDALPGGRFAPGSSLPAKRAVERAFPGCRGRNDLVGVKEFGTRICIQMLVNDVFEPEPPAREETPCAHCERCVKACPAGAIGAAFDANACLRAYMGGGVIPDWVKEKMPQLMGCEICQAVCPRNADTRRIPASEAVREAFAYEALLTPGRGIRPAQALVGRNFSAKRLRSQAIVLAARAGGYAALTAAFLDDPNDAIRDAARWAGDV